MDREDWALLATVVGGLTPVVVFLVSSISREALPARLRRRLLAAQELRQKLLPLGQQGEDLRQALDRLTGIVLPRLVAIENQAAVRLYIGRKRIILTVVSWSIALVLYVASVWWVFGWAVDRVGPSWLGYVVAVSAGTLVTINGYIYNRLASRWRAEARRALGLSDQHPSPGDVGDPPLQPSMPAQQIKATTQ